MRKKMKTFGFFIVIIFSLIFVSCKSPFMKEALNVNEINFKANGGSPNPDRQYLWKEETVKKPSNPSKSGHIFVGWFTDNVTFNSLWDFNDIPLGDMTLFAKWGFNKLGLSLDELNFGSRESGYPQVSPINVTITNFGNLPTGKLTLTSSNPSSFIVSTYSIESLEEGESIDFSVSVASGLTKGVYTAVITIAGENCSISIEAIFVVDPIPITSASVSSISQPQTDSPPIGLADIIKDDSEFYTISSVDWSPHSSTFQPETIYTVSVTLTADLEYTFYGLTSAQINGLDAVINISANGVSAVISYTFAKTNARIITNITVTTNPKLNYIHGNTLDLSLLRVRVDYNTPISGPPYYYEENLTYADLSSKGIAISLSHGLVLNHLTPVKHDGETITLTHTNSLGTNFNITQNTSGVPLTLVVDKAAGASVSAPVYDSHTYVASPFSYTYTITAKTSTKTGALAANEQVIEYAISDSTTPPASAADWQEAAGTTITFTEFGSPVASPLAEDTRYYVYARSKESTNFKAGNASTSAYFAIWTVTFNANYEITVGVPNIYDVQHIESGLKAAAPNPNPVRSGYRFDGWFKEATCTTAWNFAVDTVRDITNIYAKWTPNTAGITLSVEQIKNGDPLFSGGGNIIISRNANGNPKTLTITISNPQDYDSGSIRWEITGVGIYSGQYITASKPKFNDPYGRFTLDAEDERYNSLDGHQLRLYAKINGVEYIRSIFFTVTN